LYQVPEIFRDARNITSS